MANDELRVDKAITPHSALRTPHLSSGFTLTELLAAVVIAGILAAIAVPVYQKTIQRNYWRVAGDVLMTVYAGERAYFLTNGFYFAPPLLPTSGMAQWRIIFMDDPNLASIPLEYGVVATSVNPQGFPASYSAIGRPKDGTTCGLIQRTIDQNRVDDGAGLVCWPGCSSC